MEYRVKKIVPGCFVERKVIGGGAEEFRVLALTGTDAIVVDYNQNVTIAPITAFTLKYATVGNEVFNRSGKFIRKLV